MPPASIVAPSCEPVTSLASAPARSGAWVSVPVTWATTSALAPSELRSAEAWPAGAVQYELISLTSVCRVSTATAPRPALRAAALSAPAGALTSSTKLVSPESNLDASSAFAFDDCAAGSSNPPEPRCLDADRP